MYETPEDYLDTEKEKQKKQRRWSLKKALQLAEMKKTKEQRTNMSSDEVVEAAKKFNDFIKEK